MKKTPNFSKENQTNLLSFLLLLTLLGFVIMPQAFAKDSTVISEQEIIKQVQQKDLDIIASQKSIELIKTQKTEAKLRPNPSLDFKDEALYSKNHLEEREQSLSFTIPFDLSSRRDMALSFAHNNIDLARLELSTLKNQKTLEALVLFYKIIAQKKQKDIHQYEVDSLSKVIGIIEKRRKEGRASGYDQVRIEIELEFAKSRLRQNSYETQKLKEELVLRLGLEKNKVQFSGDLSSQYDPQNENSLENSIRPSLAHLGSAEKHAKKAKELSGSSWVPDFSIHGGYKQGKAHEKLYGYELGFSLDLPFFDHGQALKQKASSNLNYLQSRKKALKQRIEIKKRKAFKSLISLKEELQKFNNKTSTAIKRLEKSAQIGYLEGHRSILETLDARHARTKVELHKLKLSLLIKLAELKLRASKGDFE